MLQYGLHACASDFLMDEDHIWFVPFGYRYLCCYNLQQNKIENKIRIPVENNMPVLYGSMMKSGSKIILIPYDADCAIAYCVIDGKITKFSEGGIREERYLACCVENDNVWMIPWIRKTSEVQDVFIKKINLYDGKAEFLKAFPKNTVPNDRGERWLFNGSCVYIEDSIYIGYRNYLLRIDLCNGCREAYAVGSDKAIYTTMCQISNERLCMMDIYGNVVIWDRKSGQLAAEIKNESICLKKLGVPNGHGYREKYRSSVVYRNECVWFFPSHADKVLQLNLKNNMLSEAWFSGDICGNVMERPDSCGQFSKAYIRGDYLYVWNLWNESFFIIDLRYHKIERKYIEVGLSSDEFCPVFWKYMEENEGICREGALGTDGLNLFIRSICSEEYDRYGKNRKSIGKCGAKIWYMQK